MFFDFHNYLYTIKDNDIYFYFNECYSTALLTRNDLKDNVLYHRMNFLIDYYVSEINKNKNINKNNYINYYMNNYKDDFKELIDDYKKNYNKKEIDITHDFDKDVIDHYSFITSKPPQEPEIDYEEYDKKFYLEEEEKRIELENNINEYKDDDDYYDDDYYEDDIYYEEDDYYNCSKDDYY